PSAPPYLLAGGPNFISEELLAYELGYRVAPLSQLNLSATAFYHDYDHIRSVEQAAPPAAIPVVIGNGLRGNSYGAEFAGEYLPAEWWRLHAGYTYLRVRLHPRPGSTDTS